MSPMSSIFRNFYLPLGFSSAARVFCLVPLAILPYIVYKDYHAFLKLGPGGPAYNFLGYLEITALRLFTVRDPYAPTPVPADVVPSQGRLPSNPALFPRRPGPRPRVIGIAPHRQETQQGDARTFRTLASRIQKLRDENSTILELGTSCLEKRGTGLFSKYIVNRTCNGEVCHVHNSESSLHVTLHPADLKVILEGRWGERHPLTSGAWCTKHIPTGFALIYAPRNDKELEVVMEIIKAAIWWVGGYAIEDTDMRYEQQKINAAT